MGTAIILFAHKTQDSSSTLVTVDVLSEKIKLRSIFPCKDVVDVALFTEPEEIYLVKKSGDVVLYDASKKMESVKIANKNAKNSNLGHMSEYQLFVNRKEQICVMQSASEVPNGRKIDVYTYSQQKLYSINLDLGQINIPGHLERSKGKEEKYCMFEQTGLSLFIFDEDKFIAVHDYERSFPAVLDIYKFW